MLGLIKREVRDYIATNFLFDGSATMLSDTTSLVEDGVVDPTGVIELLLWVEDAYGVIIDYDEIGPENFDTIDAIASYIFLHLANQ